MRSTATFFGLALTAAITSAGCASHGTTHPSDNPTTAVMPATVWPSVNHHGHGVLWVPVANGTNYTTETDALHVRSHDGFFDIWLVDAKTVDAATPMIPEVIKSEFTDFTPTSTTSITIAGAPAKHVMGAGSEADDQDPGTADVVVFTAGGRVFIAACHAEHLPASTQAYMMSTLHQVSDKPVTTE